MEIHAIVAVALALLAITSGRIAFLSIMGHPEWEGSYWGLWAIYQAPFALLGAVYFVFRAIAIANG